MAPSELLTNYVDAFNRGQAELWGACYAPDVVLRNGAGTVLRGREAIIAYYTAFGETAQRTMTVRGICEGDNAIAAALQSRFTSLVDGLELAGLRLLRGQNVEIESVALYELRNGLFARIEATTVARRALSREQPE